MAAFTGFDPYKLAGVRVTDQKLGHGSYATVLELEYMGLKCAGKRIHELLLKHGDASYTVHRFEEECNLLSLGVARILNLTPLQVSCMTQTPGTPTYMPPEVMLANPKYDTSVDEFSFGILMMHTFSGSWPEPQVGPNRTEHDGLENQIAKICRSLLEEREQFAIQLTEEQEQHEIQVRKEREQSKIQVGKQREQFSIEREADRKLMASIHDLQAELSKYQS